MAKKQIKFSDEELNNLLQEIKENPHQFERSGGSTSFKFYGITRDIYNQMLVNQDFKCAICGTHQSNLKKQLHIDHCHNTKKVRGLLCQKCNSGLGFFKDSVDSLQNAITYLKNN